MFYDRAIVPVDQMEAVSKNIKYNQVIWDYYERMKNNLPVWVSSKDVPIFKQARLSNCNKFWISDYYEGNKVKDFQKTSLCEDKFCNNCKKVKQARRLTTFEPEIRKYIGSIYHLTLTVPNVAGEDLPKTISTMKKAFARLIMYFKGNTKSKGLDFSQFNYQGAVRSLEVTFKENIYHPHYHVILVANLDPADAQIKNAFSVDHFGIRQERLFTKQEELIQKLWRTLFDGKKVTSEEIQNLENGYSCTLDRLKDEDFLEVFKYMTKATDEDHNQLSYDQFLTLYKALDGVRQIQGYGCLFRLTDEGLITPEAIDDIYNDILMMLQESEKPVKSWDTPQAISKDSVIVISRKRIANHLREIYQHHDDSTLESRCQKGGVIDALRQAD